MKNFEKFIKEEVDLRGNKGVPDDFMRKSDEEARKNLGVRPDDESQMRNLWPSFEGAMRQSQQILSTGPNGQRLSQQEVQERITKLEKLAEKVVRDQFDEILDASIKPIELDIKLYQALFGFNTVITHLDNRKLSLTYREKTDVNTIRKIKNEGMKYLQSDLRGDLYIKFNVSIPSIKLLDDNSKTQLKILLQLVEPNLEKQELKSSGEKTNSFSPQNSKVSDPSINKVISDLPSQNLADKIHKVILCDCTQDEVNKLNKSQNQTKSVNEQDNDKNHYAFESNFASGQMGNTTECRQS